jgi:acetyl esterase/lipase
MAAILAQHGIASWNVEYWRGGHPGGGWPGTFRDLADATDFVRELAPRYPIDTQRTILVGHSSGGYFAGWIAGRGHLPANSPLTGPAPLKLAGLVLLDAFLDPRVIDSRGVDGRLFCDELVLPRLIGGDPETMPDHLQQASPLARISDTAGIGSSVSLVTNESRNAFLRSTLMLLAFPGPHPRMRVS